MPITLLPMHAVVKQTYYCLHIAHNNAQHFFFKVQKTLEGFLEHYSGEFIEISCIVEIEALLSILTFHVSLHYWPLLRVPEHIMKFPFSGSHLHLVIVSDKSSRGEVADLIARILTR